MRPIGILALALLLASCGGGGGSSRDTSNPKADTDAPSWLLRPPTAPGKLYAAGAGPNRDAAQENARFNLVAQLQINISGSRSGQSHYHSSEGTDQARSERLEEAITQRIVARINQQELPGISIEAEHPGETRHYVLLVFNRQAWAASLHSRIDEIDRDIANARMSALDTESEDPLVAARRLYQEVMPLIAEREEMSRRLRIAVPGITINPPPIDVGALRDRLASLLNDISIELPAELTIINAAITNSLASQGFTVMEAGQGAIMRLKLNLDTHERELGGSIRCDGSLTGSLVNNITGQVMTGIALNARGGSNTAALAQQRVRENLADELADFLDTHILGLLAN